MHPEVQPLHAFLKQLHTGVFAVDTCSGLIDVLKQAWPHLQGSEINSTEAYKLDRMEQPIWQPPVLTFTLERHGAIVAGGSKRAELHKWVINVEKGTADCSKAGARNLLPNDKAFPFASTVEELIGIVCECRQHPWIKWVGCRYSAITRQCDSPSDQQTDDGITAASAS